MKYPLVVGALVLLIAVGLFVWNSQSSQLTAINSKQPVNNQPGSIPTAATQADDFNNPKKSAHYESNTPAHGATLAAAPVNIVINFNFDLAKPSAIKMLKDGKDYGVGETVIDTNKLAMRRNVTADALGGLYTVEYNACWPDGSCHDGYFEFIIDRSQAGNYQNQTGKKEVIIKMSEIKFNPQDVKISTGTKVIWVNDDTVEHYINTASHPAHSYYPAQNSKVLKKGEQFSLTFDQIGIYPYHCSAHAESMTGSLLVE